MKTNTRVIIAESDSSSAEDSASLEGPMASEETWTPSLPTSNADASPYEHARRWIAGNSKSTDAERLARLLLCLSRTEWWEYSVLYECTDKMDTRLLEMAITVSRYYLEVGSSAELRAIADEALSMFPSLAKAHARAGYSLIPPLVDLDHAQQ